MSSTQPQPVSPAPHLVETPYSGIQCEWYFDKQLVVYQLTAVSQVIIQHWETLVLDTLRGWDKSKPYLAIHDVSGMGISLQYATMVRFDLMNIGITDQGRDWSDALFNQFPEFRARVAINFNLSVSGQVSQTVMDRIKMKHPSISYKTYFSRDRALVWLMETLQPRPSNSSADQTQEIQRPNGNTAV